MARKKPFVSRKFSYRIHLSLIAFATSVGLLALVTGNLLDAPSARASAGINSQINFQGRLLNAQGATVPDGTYNIQFKIYQDGDGLSTGDTTGSPAGTLLWTESYLNSNSQGVTVTNGYFSVLLGSINTTLGSLNFNSNTLWLSLNIGGTGGTASYDGEMLPMKRFAANPYAMNAGLLGGLSPSQYLQVGTGVTQIDASSNTTLSVQKTSGTGDIINVSENLGRGSLSIFKVNNSGFVTFTPTANGTSFVVNNSSGSPIITVSSNYLGIGAAFTGGNIPAYQLDVAGDINSSTALRVGGTTVCTSSGCTPTGGGSYVVNGTSLQSSANFNIDGTGTAATLSFTSGLKAGSTQISDSSGNLAPAGIAYQGGANRTLSVASNAGGGGYNLTVSAGNAGASGSYTGGSLVLQGGSATTGGTAGSVIVKGQATPSGGTAQTTTFQVQDSSANSILNVDGPDALTTATGTLVAKAQSASVGTGLSVQTYTGFATFTANSSTASVTVAGTSTSAFKIQDASGVQLLNANTSTASIVMGTAANNVTLTASTFEPILNGNARHAKTIVLTPEYAGAVLDVGGDVGCTANNGTMTSGYDATAVRNYYKWTTSQSSSQCYDIVVQIPIPSDFAAWATTSSPFVITDYASTTAANTVNLDIHDTTGVLEGTSYSDITPSSTSTWQNKAYAGTPSGTYTPGGYMTMRLRLTSPQNGDVRLGPITLNYLSKY